MTKYAVTGGVPLKGEVILRGAKNAGFKAMIASLLCDSPSTIENISHVGDISTTKEVIECLGGRVEECGDHCLKITPNGISSFDAPKSCGLKSRAGSMFVGPLLAKFGKAILPIPGGDKIGVRPIDRHLAGLEALGAVVEFKDGLFYISTPNGLTGGNFRFKKNTHTGTETLIMAAVKARGKTILENAAAEPEIDNLIDFLNRAGGNIKRTSSRTIEIYGVDRLTGVKHKIMPDRNAGVTFACAALATKGDVFIRGAQEKFLGAFISKVQEAGGGLEIEDGGIRFFWQGPLKSTKVSAVPYPGFMTDWQAVWATLMTQAQGESEVIETIFENRFGYVSHLTKMGANITMFNPVVSNPEEFYNFNLHDDNKDNFHAVLITGPTLLASQEVEINDVRAGATMLLAGMIAKGETNIYDPHSQIDRGYEKLDENLVGLGARIVRTNN